MSTTAKDRVVRLSVSPAQARKLLATVDTQTYRWKKHNYAKLLAAMQGGFFEPLASVPLVVDFDGKLWNGRHRLEAQADLNLTYTYNVRYCSPEMGRLVQERGDAPAAWNTGDELRARGEGNRYDLGTALTYAYRFAARGAFTSRTPPAPTQALALLDANPSIRDWVSGDTVKAARQLRISKGMCVATAFLATVAGASDQDVREFWASLAGISSPDPTEVQAALSEAGDAVLPLAAFTEWVNRQQPRRGQAVRLSANAVWVQLVRTWNAWTGGYSLSYRSMRRVAPSALPAISGGPGNWLEPGSASARKALGLSG